MTERTNEEILGLRGEDGLSGALSENDLNNAARAASLIQSLLHKSEFVNDLTLVRTRQYEGKVWLDFSCFGFSARARVELIPKVYGSPEKEKLYRAINGEVK